MVQGQDAEALWTSLLLDVAQGSRVALKRLYKASAPRLHTVVRRVQPDPAEAEDVLQEVYIKVWMHACTFDPTRGPAAAWLHGIAHNAALDSLRRARSRPQGRTLHDDEGADPYGNLRCPEPAPPERLQGLQRAQAVRRSLSMLPAHTRELVLLAYEHELSHSQAAERLGRPLGTVKSLLRRSLQLLRPALAAHR